MRRPVGLLALAAALTAGVRPAASQTETPVPGPTLGPPRLAQPPACTVVGTPGDDRLTGTGGPDVICGQAGNDVLEGLEGDDVLDGGEGVDAATWESAACCVRADLGAGSATGSLGTDALVGMENLTGSLGDDVLHGDAATNVLNGLAGTDLLRGGDGDDLLLGGDGDDHLAGEAGANSLDGGPGADVCVEGTGASCYPPSPADPDDVRGPLDVRLVTTAFTPTTATWRVAASGKASRYRLWDEGYVVVSLDTGGDRRFEWHVVARSTGRRMRGLLLRAGSRWPNGRARAQKPAARVVTMSVPLARLEISAERAYFRWAVRTVVTATGCRACLDEVPAEGEGALPQPVA